MNKLLLTVFVLASGSAYADHCNKKETCPVPKPKPQPTVITKVVKEPCCDKDKGKQESTATQEAGANANSNLEASTGNQTVTVNIPRPKPVIIYKTKYKTKIKRSKVVVDSPNRLQLMLGLSNTKLSVENDGCCRFTATKSHEPDVGLQYLRDVGSFTGSVGMTMNKNMYLGIGFNW